eukprot:m.213910 g.213910  ORF g.213910 m.213910 type:complete len:557 (+) comp17182_c0_seq2:255-1925(+)
MDRWNVSDEPIFEPPPKAPRRYPSSLPCFESFDFNLYPLSNASRTSRQTLSQAPQPFPSSLPMMPLDRDSQSVLVPLTVRQRAREWHASNAIPHRMREHVTQQQTPPFSSPFHHNAMPTPSCPTWTTSPALETSRQSRFGSPSSQAPLPAVSPTIVGNHVLPDPYGNPEMDLLKEFGQPGSVALAAVSTNGAPVQTNKLQKLEKVAFLRSTMSKPDLVDAHELAQASAWPTTVVCFDVKSLLIAGLRIPHEVLVFDLQVAAWVLASDSDFLTLSTCQSLITEVPGPELNVKAQLDFMMERYDVFHAELIQREQLELVETIEMPVARLLADMTTIGITVDVARLTAAKASLSSRIAQLETEAQEVAGQKFLLSSSVQLREVLYTKLKLGQGILIPKTGKGQLSTNEDALNKLLGKHPLPGMVLEYRHCCKLLQTYIDGVVPYLRDDQIHADWNQTAVASGRLSCSNPNLQNLPTEASSIVDSKCDIRSAFVPREDYVMLACDWAQIEFRLLAHLCQDAGLIKLFTAGSEDVFKLLAVQWLGKSEAALTVLPVVHESS